MRTWWYPNIGTNPAGSQYLLLSLDDCRVYILLIPVTNLMFAISAHYFFTWPPRARISSSLLDLRRGFLES
jgi:hypothetical protein